MHLLRIPIYSFPPTERMRLRVVLTPVFDAMPAALHLPPANVFVRWMDGDYYALSPFNKDLLVFSPLNDLARAALKNRDVEDCWDESAFRTGGRLTVLPWDPRRK